MNLIFRKVVAVAGLMPFCMVASAGNMSAGEVHAVFWLGMAKGEWQVAGAVCQAGCGESQIPARG